MKQTTGVRAELKLRDSLACVNKQKRAEIFAKLKAGNPNPTSELNFRTPFELLVAVVLSAQATDKRVNKVTEKLFRVASTPRAFLELGEERLKEYIKTIGLYNSKAKNLIKTCAILGKFESKNS